LAALIDIELLERTGERILARVAVTDSLRQPLGLVHGGVYATIADAITNEGGRVVSSQTSFLRPITDGTIHATARRRHKGRTTAVWEVDIEDDAGRLCALVRTTVYPDPDPGRP
jgi:1,4-dihydroxy-2-naphthoyl-CoA hydrolase